MVELSQAARVIEADACTIVHDGLCLVVKLIVAFEDVFFLCLWDALACIGHRDLDDLARRIQRHIDMSATGGELQGVRQQVGDNLLQLVAIRPCHEGLLFRLFPQTKAPECQAFLLHIELKGVEDVIHGLNHINLLYAQAQGVILEFIEVHQLVDKLKHTLDAALGNAEQTTLLATE